MANRSGHINIPLRRTYHFFPVDDVRSYRQLHSARIHEGRMGGYSWVLDRDYVLTRYVLIFCNSVNSVSLPCVMWATMAYAEFRQGARIYPSFLPPVSYLPFLLFPLPFYPSTLRQYVRFLFPMSLEWMDVRENYSLPLPPPPKKNNWNLTRNFAQFWCILATNMWLSSFQFREQFFQHCGAMAGCLATGRLRLNLRNWTFDARILSDIGRRISSSTVCVDGHVHRAVRTLFSRSVGESRRAMMHRVNKWRRVARGRHRPSRFVLISLMDFATSVAPALLLFYNSTSCRPAGHQPNHRPESRPQTK